MGEMKPFRVLVIDDDRDILDLLEYNFQREGFKVKTLEDSHKAIKVAKEFSPELIILDIMMPHPNGIEVCRQLRSIRRFQETYIFFLTAKSENYYHEAALDTGGDDFIEKVIGLRALTYKVSSVLKRNFIIRKGVPEITVGNIKVNRKANSVTIGKREVVLSKPEFELLFFFAQNPSKVITMDNLLHNIWGSEIYLFEASVDVYVQNLKNKIGIDLIKNLGDNSYRMEFK
jgi:two-component system alkaline phosphatase synthesis response regulator PhoP